MTLMMSDLPEDLIEDILSRVPITSLGAVRSTCKRWNNLSKDRIVCKGETKPQFLGFMVKESKVCSLRFDLINGIQNQDVELAGTSIKQIDKFNELRIFQVNNCNGLLLLVTKEINFRLVVWNPYLGQTRLVQPRINFDFEDSSHHQRDWILENSGSRSSFRTVSSPTSVLLCSKFSANQSRPRTIAYVAKEKIEIIINQWLFLQYLVCFLHHLL
ncbi:PREDICTED: putative F-box protein At1g67450, partial [Camelina sativa]|uniref:F-box protein At1g67450 n=1 Tax=Camelina sativa TaxID=90675 RepID=A0ABM1RPK4_CAMSA